MDAETFMPNPDPHALSERCKELIRASGSIQLEILRAYPQLKERADRLSAAGWRIGVDALCSPRGELAIALVAVAPSGERLVLATIPGPRVGAVDH